MTPKINRRQFSWLLAGLPFAIDAIAKADSPTLPIIDSHIHLFDKNRAGGAPWPRDANQPPGTSALPTRYRNVVKTFGVVGAIVVEAQVGSPQLELNQWVLDQAASDPIIVGTVGRLDPSQPEFGRDLDRFRKNPLFLGIRQSQIGPNLGNPLFLPNLKLLAAGGLAMDNILPSAADATANLVRVSDAAPSLRIVINHLPGTELPKDSAGRESFMKGLSDLAARPQVYIKLSEVVKRVGDKVPIDLSLYKDWLDQLWALFGENRVIFGSDWPNSENVELDSYPHVVAVARAFVEPKGPAVMEKVFWRNSISAYRWLKRDASQPSV